MYIQSIGYFAKQQAKVSKPVFVGDVVSTGLLTPVLGVPPDGRVVSLTRVVIDDVSPPPPVVRVLGSVEPGASDSVVGGGVPLEPPDDSVSPGRDDVPLGDVVEPPPDGVLLLVLMPTLVSPTRVVASCVGGSVK